MATKSPVLPGSGLRWLGKQPLQAKADGSICYRFIGMNVEIYAMVY